VNLAAVMDEVAARLRTMSGLRVHAHPPDGPIHPPAAVVTYPPKFNYDATFNNGMDSIGLSVVLLVGRVGERSSRDLLSAWVSNAGDRRHKLQNAAQLTKYVMTPDLTPVAHVSAPVVTDDYLQVQLTAGGDVGFSNLREFYVRDDISAVDWHARATFDPPYYGSVTGPSVDILPQHGLVLRFQRDTKMRAVTLNHNIIFHVPFLNVGVWHANLDGSGFASRGYPSWPLPFGLALPFTVEAWLSGNVVTVRQWEVGDQPPSPSDTDRYRVINLDTESGDAVAIPTPVGLGSAGVMASHLGTDPRSMIRYPLNDLYWEERSSSLKVVLETATYTEFDTLRVESVEFDTIRMGGIDYLAATFTLDIAGNGD
jgi:hypothetical protein